MSKLGDYEQGDLIGSGGFADVYRAVHVPSRRAVALKVSRQDDEALARIRREIEVQRKLAHANVMKILDWDREGFAWFVTDLAEGSLGAIHDRTPITEPEVVRFVEEVLAGLGAAHRRAFVHRDLSPENVLRTQGRWVLADWGYVADSNATGIKRLTRTGTAGGTPTWAAPEVLQNARSADARSDLYSLGKIAAWTLIGRVPGIGMAPELPEGEPWRGFLARLTASDPLERFQSTEEALSGFATIAASSPAIVEGPPEPATDGFDPVAASVEAIKRYLVGPEHRIRLFDMMTKLTQETLERLSDNRFRLDRLDQGDALLERLQAYVECCRPLMHLLFTAGHFGEAVHEELWTTCVQRIADREKPLMSGYTKMGDLLRFPTLLVMSAGALGAVLGGRLGNLEAMTLRARYWREGQVDLPLIARVTTASTIDRDMLRATARFKDRKTPGSEILFEHLRELGRSVLVSEAEYQSGFDRFEIIVSLLTADAGGWATGCFAWRDGIMGRISETGPLFRMRKEFQTQGAKWPLLKAGLFASEERVTAAFDSLTNIAEGVAGRY